ncbi:uncharacterized protein LTHEOB_11851 [Lasiodiplodia theobromae]|uniref:uncharacterized protein n=1 Tax=Lasiodiplodia theobromae TaxID=45133 RepID=UPI0015C30664|nr:uncharacterized protein LTHEOB_11851 [Lasiodiplodia theobromae]KAF4536844.1 hypothetical protein LTHEOB_11851 [Lasiodiplodia theobromae]
MVLGYGGFFGLDDYEYQKHLREMSSQDLQKQEIAKLRRQITCALSIAVGICMVVLTRGGSLIIASTVGGRRWRVAHRKLEMIRAELTRRGIPLHKLDSKDIEIPLLAQCVGAAVGAGLDFGLSTLVEINDVADFASGQTVFPGLVLDPELEQTASVPKAAAHGVLYGAINQPEHALQGAQSVAELIGIAPGDQSSNVAMVNSSSFSIDNAEIDLTNSLGQQLGEDAALSLESGFGEIIAQQLCWWITESFEDGDWYREASEHLGCSRLCGVRSMKCNSCSKEITSGFYWRKWDPLTQPDWF